MAKTGRPKGSGSRYTLALDELICSQIAEGIPLRQICREQGISWVTAYNWMEAHPAFGERITRARQIGFDAIAEECLDIADESGHDTVSTEHGERANTEWISRSKLRVETRLKLLAKWDPKRYGDKVETTLKGDPAAPVALHLSGSDISG